MNQTICGGPRPTRMKGNGTQRHMPPLWPPREALGEPLGSCHALLEPTSSPGAGQGGCGGHCPVEGFWMWWWYRRSEVPGDPTCGPPHPRVHVPSCDSPPKPALFLHSSQYLWSYFFFQKSEFQESWLVRLLLITGNLVSSRGEPTPAF